MGLLSYTRLKSSLNKIESEGTPTIQPESNDNHPESSNSKAVFI